MVIGYGKVEYFLPDGRSILLTLVGEEDEDVLLLEGITALRRLRIKRLLEEARTQGYNLSVKELAELLYVSKSTIFRDLACLRAEGLVDGPVPVNGQKTSHRSKEEFVKED